MGLAARLAAVGFALLISSVAFGLAESAWACHPVSTSSPPSVTYGHTGCGGIRGFPTPGPGYWQSWPPPPAPPGWISGQPAPLQLPTPTAFAMSPTAAPTASVTAGRSLPAETPAPAEPRALGFPLSVGSRWVYEGTLLPSVQATGSAQGDPLVASATMEVVDVVRRGNVRAAMMRGYPLDALSAQAESEAGPSEYLLVDVGGLMIYRVQGPRAEEVLRRLRDLQDGLHGLVAPEEIFLDLPLAVGKRFCEPDQIARDDGSYCWVVESEEPLRTIALRGEPLQTPTLEYGLRYQALSGPVFLRFAPGIGITGLAAFHPSSRSSLQLVLVEYAPGREE